MASEESVSSADGCDYGVEMTVGESRSTVAMSEDSPLGQRLSKGSAEIPWDRGRRAGGAHGGARPSGKRPRELALGGKVSGSAESGLTGGGLIDGGDRTVRFGDDTVFAPDATPRDASGRPVGDGNERAAARPRLAGGDSKKRSAGSDESSSDEESAAASVDDGEERDGRRRAKSTVQASAPDAATFSSNRASAEPRKRVRVASFPRVNVHTPGEVRPLPEVRVPTVRPGSLEELFWADWLKWIRDWLREARRYELAGLGKRGGGASKRPADLVVPPEAVKPQFRGYDWYLVDYLRSGGREPIVTMDEAAWTPPTLDAEAAKVFGGIYGDPVVTDRLLNGHRDYSSAEHVTLLSVNHLGALRHHEALAKAFSEESAEDVGWLKGPFDFLPCFPCRVEPCNGVAQGSKVRVTTDKSWPKPGMSKLLSVNDGIDLADFGAVEFGRVSDLSKAVAILMTMEPAPPTADGASSDGDGSRRVFMWKVDLTAAYRQLHVHPSCIWNRGKAWLGQVYLDVRAQFGDASQVKSFQDITDMVVGVARLATAGDTRAREACAEFMTADDWAALDKRSEEACRWAAERSVAGLRGDDLIPLFLMGYIDDFLGSAYERATAVAQCKLVRGILIKLGFPLKEEKTVWPERRMEALGADINADTGIVKLAEPKAEHYGQLLDEIAGRSFAMQHELEELVSKLCYAAQFAPVGRAWLTCGFAAIAGRWRNKRAKVSGEAAQKKKKRRREGPGRRGIFIGNGLRRELEWWADALQIAPGVALFPKSSFDETTRGEYFFDASTSWGVGGAAVCGDVCYFWQHRWRDGEDWHVNVGEGFGEYGSLRLFSAVLPFTDFRSWGDNMVANACARKGKTPTRRHAEILRERGLFAMQHSLGTENVYVNTLENKMADPLSRGDGREHMELFRAAARERGARRFVRLVPDAHLLELADRVSAISHEGDEPEREVVRLSETSETTVSVEMVDETEETAESETFVTAEPGERDDEPVRFGHISGFAGMDGPAAAFAPLGGVPIAAFDSWLTVRKLWESIYDARCFGDFDEFTRLVHEGQLDDLIEKTLIYTAGTPCPDWSAAGLQRGADGSAGGDLWLRNVAFSIFCRFPVILLEQVTGMLDLQNGHFVHEATRRLESAGYLVQWQVIQCNEFGGDATSRRRIFLVAILPGMLREGVQVGEFFPSLSGQQFCCLEDIADDIYDEALVHSGPINWLDRRGDDDRAYSGPILLGKIGEGGIGQHVYCASGPVITQKTWGEGAGEASGLYRFKDGVVRRLAPAEAMRAHSFPDPVISAACSFPPEEQTKLVGNSIPVQSLRRLMAHLLGCVLDQAQVPRC